jgi:hypothetical protein
MIALLNTQFKYTTAYLIFSVIFLANYLD